MSKFQKGQRVCYTLDRLGRGYTVEARVRRVHRDGTVTVEASFCLKPNGKPNGGYLGYFYRYSQDILRAA